MNTVSIMQELWMVAPEIFLLSMSCIILIIGSITAFFMGFIAIVSHDIKRIIAYSTLSQLGYMMTATHFTNILFMMHSYNDRACP